MKWGWEGYQVCTGNILAYLLYCCSNEEVCSGEDQEDEGEEEGQVDTTDQVVGSGSLQI